jgi:hypothetical protein
VAARLAPPAPPRAGPAPRVLRAPALRTVAEAASFPLILLLGAIAYVLCQRFVDGGQKLASPGRGDPHDGDLEF